VTGRARVEADEPIQHVKCPRDIARAAQPPTLANRASTSVICALLSIPRAEKPLMEWLGTPRLPDVDALLGEAARILLETTGVPSRQRRVALLLVRSWQTTIRSAR
jgi:hypothetical protein